MAHLFGTNTIFSTFTKVYPAPCNESNNPLKDDIKQCIFNNKRCPNPECYTSSLDLLDYLTMFQNMPVTYFMFDDGTYDIMYKDADKSDKLKIAKAHLVMGHVLPETVNDRMMRITTVSRKSFYIDGFKKNTFHMVDNYPITYANILDCIKYKNILIYFIDMPLFSLEQLYIDTSST